MTTTAENCPVTAIANQIAALLAADGYTQEITLLEREATLKQPTSLTGAAFALIEALEHLDDMDRLPPRGLDGVTHAVHAGQAARLIESVLPFLVASGAQLPSVFLDWFGYDETGKVACGRKIGL